MSRAAKDISQGGIVGTAAMLAECSGVAIDIDINAIPKPAEVALERWLLTFPSFGYLLSVKPWNVAETIARFAARGIAAAAIGVGHRMAAASASATALRRETIWDFADKPLIGAGGRTRQRWRRSHERESPGRCGSPSSRTRPTRAAAWCMRSSLPTA